MKYMLDTNICIYIIRERPPQVLNKFKSLHIGDVCISSVTFAEMMYGVHKSQHPQKNRNALEQFVAPLEVLPFNDEVADYYGQIRTQLEKKGKLIGPLDLMIAAHAQCLDLILVTNNKKEFSRVSNLEIEDWAHH